MHRIVLAISMDESSEFLAGWFGVFNACIVVGGFLFVLLSFAFAGRRRADYKTVILPQFRRNSAIVMTMALVGGLLAIPSEGWRHAFDVVFGLGVWLLILGVGVVCCEPERAARIERIQRETLARLLGKRAK